MTRYGRVLVVAVGVLAACADPECPADSVDVTTVSTLRIVLVSESPADRDVAGFTHRPGAAGEPGGVDGLSLRAGLAYEATLEIRDEVACPIRDLLAPAEASPSSYQVLFTGTALAAGPDETAAPLAHGYADADDAGLPVGLRSRFTTAPGSGLLTVTLRHLPPIDGVAQKVPGLEEDARVRGLADVPGSTDAELTVPVLVEQSWGVIASDL